MRVKIWSEKEICIFIFFCCCLFFSSPFCCYLLFICFSSLYIFFTTVKSNILSSISPLQAELTMKPPKTQQLTQWQSVRHLQIGPCWSYASPVAERRLLNVPCLNFSVSDDCLPLDAPPPPACQSLSWRWPAGRQRRHFHVKLARAENRNINRNIYVRSRWVNVASTNGCLSSLVKHKVSQLSITENPNPNPNRSLKKQKIIKTQRPCHLV